MSIPAITALLVALTGAITAVGVFLNTINKRTKKIDIKVNGHLTQLIDLLSQADITLPSGVRVKYEPPKTNTPDEQNALDYIEQIRKEVNGA